MAQVGIMIELMERPNNVKNPFTPFAIMDYRDIRKRFGVELRAGINN
jgi:hypothetical protein